VKKKPNVNYRILIPCIIAMSLTLAAGHFLFQRRDEAPEIPPVESPAGEQAEEALDEPPGEPVLYIHRSEIINGLRQEINILEIDPANPGASIKPALSYDLIYGYEFLSGIASRWNAYAAVNGGFFRDYGLPSGMVVIDGELISAATGDYPVFIIRDGKAELMEIDSSLAVETGEGADAVSITIDNINFPAAGKQTIVYTPVYGRTNRADSKNITATVENGIVTRIADYEKESRIPDNGMLISFFDVSRYAGKELPIKEGDVVKLIHEPDMTGNVQAYECGCWLVRDGISVVGDRDPWVGVLTNRDPRTAIGIKEDGTVILLTVDGRQPGYSAGFTGKELADYLISCGAVNAAMLDGGASTAMFIEGELVNRPSYKGQEREVAGAMLVLKTGQK
jgi:exopolysaccharide biosynthesis protein